MAGLVWIAALTAAVIVAIGCWDTSQGRLPLTGMRDAIGGLAGGRTDRELRALVAAGAEALCLERRDRAVAAVQRRVTEDGLLVGARVRDGLSGPRVDIRVDGVGVLSLRVFHASAAESLRGHRHPVLTGIGWLPTYGWAATFDTLDGPARVVGWMLDVRHAPHTRARPVRTADRSAR